MICFFFYKNLLYGSTIFVYNAFSLFSGQPIYNDFYMTLFNVVFTAAAPLVVGWFDRDLDKNMGLKYPFLYKEGEDGARHADMSNWASAIAGAHLAAMQVQWLSHCAGPVYYNGSS
jgi:phospholipid-transporting ATPase